MIIIAAAWAGLWQGRPRRNTNLTIWIRDSGRISRPL